MSAGTPPDLAAGLAAGLSMLHLPSPSPAFVASLGWALLDFLWQGALIGCAAATLLVALRNARPETRYAVACGALLLCIACPVANLAMMLAAGTGAPAGHLLPFTVAPDAPPADAGLLAWVGRHLGAIVAAWAACAAAFALRIALGLWWIGRDHGAAGGMVDGAGDDREAAAARVWQARLSTLAARAGLHRAVRLHIVANLASPVTAGWWRPVVLVPAALVTGMPPQLLEALLAHELGHVRRHDYLVNLVQNAIEALLFYHPAVWWLSRRIRLEREQIADDFAARQLGEPRRLARALSELERLQFSHHHLAQAAAGGDLMARIRRLVRPAPQPLDWRTALPVLGLVLACAASAHALSTNGAASLAAAGQSRPAQMDFRSCSKPEYPAADIAAGHEGTVTVNFRVDASGAVTASAVARSSGHPGLDEAARSALHRCRFVPALRDGRPVSTWTPVMYVWTLS